MVGDVSGMKVLLLDEETARCLFLQFFLIEKKSNVQVINNLILDSYYIHGLYTISIISQRNLLD